MLSFEEIYQKVQNTLSEKRFYHSKCVMEACIELAKQYGEDIEKAKIAGIVHDIAKEIPKEERIEIAKEYGIELDDIEKNSKGLIHAKLGAKICEKEFGLGEEICSAVKYHTTGKENMTLLQKIVYVADTISLDRNYKYTEEVRSIAKEDLDKAVEYILSLTIEERISEGKLIHIDSVRAWNHLIIKNL